MSMDDLSDRKEEEEADFPLVRAVLFPLTILGALLLIKLVYRGLGLPEAEQLVKVSEGYFSQYGYPIVFIAAFLEAMLLLNIYLPGSTVVVLAVAYARKGSLDPSLVVTVAGLAFILAYAINYALGSYGWYTLLVRFGLGPALENAKARVEKHGLGWLFVAYVHPNLGSLASTSCGILRLPFFRFLLLSAVSVTLWNALWGLIAYFGAGELIKYLNMNTLVLAAAAWVIFVFTREYKKRWTR